MRLKGNPVSEGIAIGNVYIYRTVSPVIEEKHISPEEVPMAESRLEQVKKTCKKELEEILMQMTDRDKAKIFEAHIEIIEDEVLFDEIQDEISLSLCAPDYAVYKVFGQHAQIIGKAKDPIIRERAADLIDVRNRILREWSGTGEKNLSCLPEPSIVVAGDLLPSDTATLDRKNVLGIVTETGGATSHTAIIARNYGIPAILGVADAMNLLHGGEIIAVDAVCGEVLTGLNETETAFYQNKRAEHCKAVHDIERYLSAEAVTKDGIKADIGLNIGSADQQTLEKCKYVDMVGLFRTEFLYMESDVLPDEETQFEAYKRVLLALGDKPVILRTLDIGGDKVLPSLPCSKEENPFLGVRALRLCFSKPEVFRTQLRAALRASVYGNLWLMFPMVGSLDDLRRAKLKLAQVMDELSAEGVLFNKDIKLGVMIEIPSIALMADIVAQEVDFASIGTNDLCQYTLAADRVNPGVCDYYQSFHPGLFRLIGYAAKAFADAKKPIGVCGELGGDPLAAPVLFGLGVRELSMNMSAIAKIKKILSELSLPEMEKMARKVLSMDTEQTVKQYLRGELASLL
ncbi:MAG: phosphoenolpyruvate--protein phosphotransferase [Oscillospiraceae bacterium]|nr:phosphoenolpyruvate--protein phosphotransferase [Oscillospiraceae bacterium]